MALAITMLKLSDNRIIYYMKNAVYNNRSMIKNGYTLYVIVEIYTKFLKLIQKSLIRKSCYH
jgi:hypothetical protein